MEIKFTNHAEEKLKRRKFLRQEIIESINNPDKTLKKHEKYYYQKQLDNGNVEIICGRTEKIITLYWL